MNTAGFDALVARQHGMLARRQLRPLGITDVQIRTQTRARRWTARSSTVISTFTGELTWTQRCWLGVLHAGGSAIVGGLTAAGLAGLKNWQRPTITIFVPANVVLDPMPGIQWVRTRRNLAMLRNPASRLPIARIQPAILMFGATDRSPRTAVGVLAAAVQQRLTTPASLQRWITALTPIRRAKLLQASVTDFAGGAQSLGEIDVGHLCTRHGLQQPNRQTKRRDATGRWRYLDCRWRLPNGRSIALEVDGAFHFEAQHWQADIARERDLADPDCTLVRCTALELRTNSAAIADALRRLRVPAR